MKLYKELCKDLQGNQLKAQFPSAPFFINFFIRFGTFPVGWPPAAFCGHFACICKVFPHFEGDLHMGNVYVKRGRGEGGVPTLTSDRKSFSIKDAHLIACNNSGVVTSYDRKTNHVHEY